MTPINAWIHTLRDWLANRFKPLTLGQRGERVAAQYLRRLGYKIVASGERGRIGELDLVAVDQRTVVFVEVKTRRSDDAGDPAEAVDDRKQAKLSQLALAYLKRHGLLEYPARFDVIGITWPSGESHPQIRHYKNAFEAVGRGQMFN